MACFITRLAKGSNLVRATPMFISHNSYLQLGSRTFSKYEKTKSLHFKEEEKRKIQDYVISKYMNYVENYTKIIEKKFPKAINVYRIFSLGLKDFYKDLKAFLALRMTFTSKENLLKNCTRQEIELYYKMPRDMWKIAPVLILAAIPFGNYLVFPLAVYQPRVWLTSHFWSIQQKSEFNLLELKERLVHNRPVFRALQSNLEYVKDTDAKRNLAKVLGSIGSGVHPTLEEVIICKEIFSERPYQLEHLSYRHSGHLLKMLGLRRSVFGRKKKLRKWAFFIKHIDSAIEREGGVVSLNTDALRSACQMRGVNSSNLSNREMCEWLSQWLAVSKVTDSSTYSLLLHCPIFFAYNHPQNWMLIY